MADVQRLCHVGSAVVHHQGLALPGFGNAQTGGGAHLLQVACQKFVAYIQIQKSGHHSLNHGKVRGLELFSHSVGNLNGSALVLLGSRQGAVALELAQIRPVGYGDLAVGSFVAGLPESLRYLLGNQIQNLFHGYFPFCSDIHLR